jgi:hypothetical protein
MLNEIQNVPRYRKELVNAKHPFEVLRKEKAKNEFDNGLKIIYILQGKYYRHQGRIFGKKFL